MRTLKQRIEGTVYRTIEMRAEHIINEDERTVRLSVSSETPVLRQSFFREPWVEVLGHKRGEVNLDRLNDGAPILFNHDNLSRQNRIGVVFYTVTNSPITRAISKDHLPMPVKVI